MRQRRYRPVFERRCVVSTIPKCESILDLGCGDGIYAAYLAERGKRVFGLDSSVERLTESKGKYCDLIAADAMHLPFRNKSFDILWSSEVVEHVASLNVFDEIERVTDKMIVATVPNPKGPYYRMDPLHILSYDLQSLREFLNVRSWHYKIEGLGFCFPFYFPEMFRRLFVSVTRERPSLAFNILIKGIRRTDSC